MGDGPALAFPQNLSGTQCAKSVEVAPAMQSRNPTALAFQPRIAREGDAAPCVAIPEVAWALQHRDSKGVDSDTKEGHLIRAGFAVRRLTPRECERLQGFPDDWTAVPFRGRPAADGPRYKALGNSMAVNVMRWLGERIALVEEWAPLNA